MSMQHVVKLALASALSLSGAQSGRAMEGFSSFADVQLVQQAPSLPNPEIMLKRMDLDGDMRISRSEFRGPPQAFPNIDANGDGFLTVEEIASFQHRARNFQAQARRGLSAQPLADWYGALPVILSHTHFNVKVGTGHEDQLDWEGAETNALKLMDENGVSAAIILPTPGIEGRGPGDDRFAGLLRMVGRHPGRFRAAGGGSTLNPLVIATNPDGANEDIRRRFAARAEEIMAAGGVGFGELAALHYSFFDEHPYEEARPDHPLFLLLADIAARHDVPMDIHMEAVARDQPISQEMHGISPNNPDHVHENVSTFERLLAHNRKARIIWVHLGMDNTGDRTVELTRRLLRDHPNLYISITGFQRAVGENWLLLPGRGLNPEWRALIVEFPERFMIGSDILFQPPRVWHAFPQPIKRAIEIVRTPYLPPAVARKVAFENVQNVYRLSLIQPENYPLPQVGGGPTQPGRPARSVGEAGVGTRPAPHASGSGEMVGPRGLTARQVITINDKDGDGKLAPAEFHGSLQQFEMIDGNGDGLLTQEEFEVRWRVLMAR